MYLHKNRCKWAKTTQTLMESIRKLDQFEQQHWHRDQYGEQLNYYHGLHNVQVAPMAQELKKQTNFGVVSYPTFISTSLVRGVAETFKNGLSIESTNGTMITFNESTLAKNVYHASIAWLSKFPQEHEVLFVPHNMRIEQVHKQNTEEEKEEHDTVEEWEARVASMIE